MAGGNRDKRAATTSAETGMPLDFPLDNNPRKNRYADMKEFHRGRDTSKHNNCIDEEQENHFQRDGVGKTKPLMEP